MGSNQANQRKEPKMKRAIVSKYSMFFPNLPALYSRETKQGKTAKRLHKINAASFTSYK